MFGRRGGHLHVDRSGKIDWRLWLLPTLARRRCSGRGALRRRGRERSTVRSPPSPMSSRSSRGQEFEIAEGARLDADAAAKFRERQKATQKENEQRAARRYECLRDSAACGGFAGLLGGSFAFRQLRNSQQSSGISAPRWWQLLGISVRGASIGGGMQAFVVFVGFFMPYMFVSNVVRWRCQKSAAAAVGGLTPFQAPKKAVAEGSSS